MSTLPVAKKVEFQVALLKESDEFFNCDFQLFDNGLQSPSLRSVLGPRDKLDRVTAVLATQFEAEASRNTGHILARHGRDLSGSRGNLDRLNQNIFFRNRQAILHETLDVNFYCFPDVFDTFLQRLALRMADW